MNCPSCGGKMVKSGYHVNKTGKYQRYKCQNCGITKVDLSKNLRP